MSAVDDANEQQFVVEVEKESGKRITDNVFSQLTQDMQLELDATDDFGGAGAAPGAGARAGAGAGAGEAAGSSRAMKMSDYSGDVVSTDGPPGAWSDRAGGLGVGPKIGAITVRVKFVSRVNVSAPRCRRCR